MKVSTLSPLQSLYLKDSYGSSDPLAQYVAQYFSGNTLCCPVEFQELIESKSTANSSAIPYVDAIKNQITLWLLYSLDSNQQLLADYLRSKNTECEKLLGCAKEFQLGIAYQQLIAYFSGNQPPKGNPRQYKNGAAPLEASGYWKWAELPHQPYHSELGTLWGLLAFFTKNDRLMEAAFRLAHWQLNTLDCNFSPRVGLFTQETEASLPDILLWNYLLFLSLGTFKQDSKFLYVAQRQFEQLKDLANRMMIDLHPISPLIEKWVTINSSNTYPEQFELDRVILDPDTALVGLRQDQQVVICTMHGGYTGLGSLRSDDLEIVTYGPQHLPYGDCATFGILSPSLGPINSADLTISPTENAFSIKSYVKIAGKEVTLAPYPLFKNCGHSEVWADICQEYRNGCLSVDLLLMGYDLPDSLSFVFYVKAQQCIVDKEKTINPRSLDRYEGEVAAVELVGGQGSLKLISGQHEEVMEIIPLAGGRSFWGADFLIGFTLNKANPNYSWKIFLT